MSVSLSLAFSPRPAAVPLADSKMIHHTLPTTTDRSDDDDRHEWMLHTNHPSKSGVSHSQCSLCMVQILQLHTLQRVAHITVLSHHYESNQLVAHVRCLRCMGAAQRDADELLRHDAIICQSCDVNRCATPSDSDHTAPSPHTHSNPSRHYIDLIGQQNMLASNSDVEVDDIASHPKYDEDISIISLLHRQVVSDATQLKHRILCSPPPPMSCSIGSSKDRPIELDSDASSTGSTSPTNSTPSLYLSSPTTTTITASTHSSPTVGAVFTHPSPSAFSPLLGGALFSPLLSHPSTPRHTPTFPPLSTPALGPRACAPKLDASMLGSPAIKRVGPNLKLARNKRNATTTTTTNNANHNTNETTAGNTAATKKNLHDSNPSDDAQSEHPHKKQRIVIDDDPSTSSPLLGSSATSKCPHHPSSFSGSNLDFVFSDSSTLGGGCGGDLFSSFARKDQTDAARRQQELFAQARKRLETRKQLNLEPEVQTRASTYLPYHRGAKHVRDDAMATASSGPNSPSLQPVRFNLPQWFRSEGSTPYTADERRAACHHILASSTDATAHHALCLPNLHPPSWVIIMQSDVNSGGPGSDHVHATPTQILSHHYRRIAKLVHPDKCTAELRIEAENAFKTLGKAYHLLTQIV